MHRGEIKLRSKHQNGVWLDPRHPLLWIGAFGFLIYLQTFWFELTGWDDLLLLQSVDRLSPGLSGLLEAFRGNAFAAASGVFYRPVLTVSFLMESWIGAAGISFNFLSNITIHLVATMLLYLVLRELGKSPKLSFLFSLLFVLHPALASAVAWIPGRNDSLLAASTLASILFLIRFYSCGKIHNFFGHLIFFALALFTKETALSLLLIYPFYIWLVAGERLIERRLGVLSLGWIAITAVWAILRSHAVIAPQYLNAGGILSHISSAAPGLLQYLGIACFPFRLSVLPMVQTPWIILGAIGTAAVAVALIFSPDRSNRVVIFGLVFFVLFLIPTMITAASAQSAATVQLEHRLYLPLAGLILILTETGAARWLSKDRRNSKVAVAVILAVFAVFTLIHSRNFRDERSFWDNALRKSSDLAFVHVHIAQDLVRQGRSAEAISEFETALKLNPRELAALVNLSNLEYARGEYEKAEALLLRALPEEPGSPEARAGILSALERARDSKQRRPGTRKLP